MISIRIRLFVVLVITGALIGPSKDTAAQGISLIRDAETETIIRLYATPLFRSAGLNPEAIGIHIIRDDSLNAFVAGGQNLFLNTGLIRRATTPGEIIGVIAHETGHIAGGHLSKIPGAARDATAQSILGYILGGVAAIGGRPDVGAAVIAGAQSTATRTFLQFTRTQETAADQAAVRLLDQTKQSATGLLEFMKVLSGQELLSAGLQDPYIRTHPLSSERIDFLEQHVSTSPHSTAPENPVFVHLHARMRAKLIAFLDPPSRTLRTFRSDDTSVPARYARAIALYRQPDIAAALEIIDGLINEFPGDGYFQELKGQILFENGRANEALAPYQEAVRLIPHSSLLWGDLGRVQVATEDPALLPDAIENLRNSLSRDPNRSSVWRQLAIAYGRSNRMGETSHALAEEALLRRQYEQAKSLAQRAIDQLPEGSSSWLRAQDVISAAESGIRRKRARQ